jgi:hypothetical protein
MALTKYQQRRNTFEFYDRFQARVQEIQKICSSAGDKCEFHLELLSTLFSVIVSFQSKSTIWVYKSKNHMKRGYHKLIFSDRLYTVVYNIGPPRNQDFSDTKC